LQNFGPGAGAPGPQRRANPPPPGERRFVPDEILVEVSGIISERALERIARRHRLTRLGALNLQLLGSSIHRWRITGGRSVAAVIRALANERILASIQPNYFYLAEQASPEPAQSPAQPADSATAPAAPVSEGENQYALSKLRLPQAHQIAKGERVLVAVIDSGIDDTHPDLANVVAAKFDAVGGVDKPHRHGTAVAGAIVAHGKLSGAAPAARLLAIRAFEPNATGAQGTSFNIVNGLEWATGQGARIVNMSFGGPPDPLLRRAFSALRYRGVVLIAAVGNDGPKAPPLYPAADANVIAVTATDSQDQLYSAANRGKYIAVAAPGVDIIGPAPEGSYQISSGTSLAAAHVSGIAALLIERRQTLSPATVKRILLDTARDLGPKGRDEEFGAGLTDAYGAVLTLEPRTGATPAAAPAGR
jgi:subtilisin family serine protease